MCEKHSAVLARVDGWEVGGLFSGITQDPDALVATFRTLEKLSFGEIQSTASALSELGEAAELLALDAAQ